MWSGFWTRESLCWVVWACACVLFVCVCVFTKKRDHIAGEHVLSRPLREPVHGNNDLTISGPEARAPRLEAP